MNTKDRMQRNHNLFTRILKYLSYESDRMDKEWSVLWYENIYGYDFRCSTEWKSVILILPVNLALNFTVAKQMSRIHQ